MEGERMNGYVEVPRCTTGHRSKWRISIYAFSQVDFLTCADDFVFEL